MPWLRSDFHTIVEPKEYKEEGQCAQKGGRMLVFVICGFIKNFFPNEASYISIL